MDEVSPFEPTVVGAVTRHWRLVVAVTAVFAVLGGVYAVTRPASYKATASLTVGDPRGIGVLAGQQPEAPDRYVADQIVVFKSAALGDAAASLGLTEKPALKQKSSWYLANTTATATAADSNVLSVSFAAPNATAATTGLKVVVDAYSEVTKIGVADQANGVKAQLDASIATIDRQLSRISGKPGNGNTNNEINQLILTRASLASREVTVAGEAAHPSSGISQQLLPNDATSAGKSAVLRSVVLALALGLLLGVGLAYFRSYRKRVFAHERDPELLLAAPLLIDTSSLRAIDLLGLAPPTEGPGPEQTAQRMFAIAASLLVDQHLADSDSGIVVAVVGAQNGASCTAVTWRLGLSLASQGLRVLLVDIEGTWPPAAAWMTRVAESLPWEETDGGNVVLGEPTRRTGPFVGRRSAVVDRIKDSDPGRPGLYLCNEAPPVSSQRALRAVFRDLEHEYDVVLVNSPPFLPSADAAHLASAAGSAVVVIPARSSITEHEEVARRLRLAATTPIGYVYCCRDCDVPIPHAGTGDRLKRALHVEGAPPLRQVSGLKGSS